MENEIFEFFKKEKNNNVFEFIIFNSNSELALFVTLEFLNKISFSEKEYYSFIGLEPVYNPIEEQLMSPKDSLLDNKMVNILVTFLENKVLPWNSPQIRLVRSSATNLLSNLMRKFWVSSEDPEKIIEKLVAMFFHKVKSSIFFKFMQN